MRTIKINLYKYEELTDKAKLCAKDLTPYPYGDDPDMQQSAQKAQEIYTRIGEIQEDIQGARLYTWIQNNIIDELTRAKYYGNAPKFRTSKIFKEVDPMNLTGVCYDYAFLKPIMDFLKDPQGDSYSLSRTSFIRIWDRIIEEEEAYFYSDESFAEYCEENDLEFLINGDRYE